jgi:outer membrane protein assembly factor BamB
LKQRLWGRRLALLFFLVTLVVLAGCGGRLPAASWFGIAAGDNTVYLSANEQVFALNLESGTELWSFPLEPDQETGPFYAAPLLTGELLVVGDYGAGKLYATSQDDGVQQWAVDTDAKIVAGAIATDGGIVVANDNGEVYLVQRETQDKRLLLKADKAIWAAPLVDEANSRMYVAAMDHHLYAVDLEREEQLWSFEVGGALVGTPALSDGVLYFGGLNSRVFAVDAATGEQIWQFDTEGWVWGGPVVDGGTLYFGDMDGHFYALNAADGTERWTFQAEDGVRATPVLADGVLYFGTRGGRVYALNADDGTQKWSQRIDGSIYSQPVVRANYLLLSPHNAKVKLVALDPESGAERWAYPQREE